VSSSLLENELHAVLDSAHDRTLRQAGDLAAGAAIHAAVRPVEIDMVEYIVEFELRLCSELLSEVEGFEKRGAGVKEFGPAELVYTATAISEAVESGCLAPGAALYAQIT
jgi:hypothetical protein